jgi:tight adherence protein C
MSLMFCLLFFLLLLSTLITIMIRGKKSYASFVSEYGKPFQFNRVAPGSLYLINRFHLNEIFSRSVYKVHLKISILYGEKEAQGHTKMFIAQLLSGMLLFLIVFTLMALMNGGDLALLLWGGVISALLPLILFKDLERKIKKRNRAIILELPLFLNKIILLVNAGETVQKAILRTIEHKVEQGSDPFYNEFVLLKRQLNNNYSFHQAMEELSRRCGVQEVSIFTNTVLLNYRRGGTEFVTALRSLSHQLWGTRKAMAQTLGEEASSKLVFPLVMIFVLVMVIVAAPAVLMMQN